VGVESLSLQVAATGFANTLKNSQHSKQTSAQKPNHTVGNMFGNIMLVLKAGSGGIAEELVPDDVLTDLEDKLQEVMESTMENYDVDYQIEESKKILTYKLDGLGGKIDLLDNNVHNFITSFILIIFTLTHYSTG
jgi:meiotically up-regulated gene 157 (Mug157) protein